MYSVKGCVLCLICDSLFGRVTPSSESPNGATCSVSQGKPSLRRIKGRIHRSKSLDSIDFCEFTVSTISFTFIIYEVMRILLIKQLSLLHWICLFVRIRKGIVLNDVVIVVLHCQMSRTVMLLV